MRRVARADIYFSYYLLDFTARFPAGFQHFTRPRDFTARFHEISDGRRAGGGRGARDSRASALKLSLEM